MSALVVAVAAVAAILPRAPGGAAANGAVTIVLREANDSGIAGSAILAPAGDRTVVGLIVRGTPGGLPAHLHLGSCRAMEPAPLFPLTNAFPDAVTTTTIDLPLDEVRGSGYAIAIHRRAADLGILLDPAGIVACGDIGDGGVRSGAGVGGGIVAMPQSGTGSRRTAAEGGSWWAAAGGLAPLLLLVALGRPRPTSRVGVRPS